jgi:hypothetical protein
MTKCISILLLVVLFSNCATVYKASDFDKITKKHKTVAILPTNVAIQLRPNEMKNMKDGYLEDMEAKTGYSIQDKIYVWLLKRSDRFNYSVTFQDVSNTNAMLLKQGLDYTSLKTKTKAEICAILNVDAVISSNANMKKPMSEGAALAVGLLIGAYGSTNNVQTSIAINEAIKGDLVWKYDWAASGSVGSNTDNLVDGLMRNVARKFPYSRK